MRTRATADGAGRTQAAELVRALLERHGVPRHRHAAFVGEFFNLSRAASHQRVTKSSAWTLDEFEALAQRFGEPLAQVLGAASDAEAGRSAVLRMGGLELPCRVWLTDDGDADTATALVATNLDGVCLVVPAAAAAAGEGSRQVQRVEIGGATLAAPRVAVFEDQPDGADGVCDVLRAAGIEAVPYRTVDALLADLTQGLFDGYVIDWNAPGHNAAVRLLAAIRKLPDHRAAVLLSGNMRTGESDAHEVGAAMARFKVQMVEKPVQPPVLISALLTDGLHAKRPARS